MYMQSLRVATRMFERILLASPIFVIILIYMRKICDVTLHALKFCVSNLRLSFRYNRFKAKRESATAERSLGTSVDTSLETETQPLIPPTCTVDA